MKEEVCSGLVCNPFRKSSLRRVVPECSVGDILCKPFPFDPRGREEIQNIHHTVYLVFQPIFTMSAQQSQLKVMDNAKFKAFMKAFSSDTVSKCVQ